jgi:diacylglycerol kinase family enzyme
LFAVGNARATGAGTTIAPLAEFDDGLLDLCVVEPVARTAFAGLLLELRRGEHLDRDGVHYVQTPWVKVESETPVAVNVDGEPLSADDARLHGVAPGAPRARAARARRGGRRLSAPRALHAPRGSPNDGGPRLG